MSDSRHKTASDKLWGGRFGEQTAASLEAFGASIHYDCRLYRHDIMGSKAHAKMLAAQGLITEAERNAILTGLDEIQAEIESGRFVFRRDLEDIHMNIEARLTERIGAVGGKKSIMSLFATHPALEDRIAALERLQRGV